MARLLFGTGAKGDLIVRIQKQLATLGLYNKKLDGDYGNGTTTAVTAFQKSQGLPETGQVDTDTWTALMSSPVPGVDERCLGLTATFEGHGFTIAKGNFDGAGITWGIIGFTLQHGEVQKIIEGAMNEDEVLVRSCFGSAELDELLAVFEKPIDEQIAWAAERSDGETLDEPWRTGFARLGETPLAQRLQLERAIGKYYVNAQKTAKKFGLKSELGTALCFDIHVQNGSIKPAAEKQIKANVAADMAERDVRIIIANAVADHAKKKWQKDVRARKLTIAKGEGSVHGSKPLVLRNWGLDDVTV